ncbi:MAG: Biotin synthase related domain containing protein, partial [uncultured Acetobacteraceae bacterium]
GIAAQTRNPRRRGEVRRLLRLLRHRQAGQPSRRHRQHGRHGHLPRLRAGRAVHLPPEGAVDQRLRLRLRVLRQPRPIERAARPFHRARAGRPDPGLLPPQLHRRPVPLLRHHPLARLHDGAGGGGGARAARGPRLPRLHPPQDHPRGLARAAGRSRALCRPPLHQHRNAPRAVPEGAGAGKGLRRHPPLHGPDARPYRRGEGRGGHRPASRFQSRRAPLRARRPIHPDGGRRRRGGRPRRARHQRQPVRQLPAQAGLLLRLFAHPGRLQPPAAATAAVAARAPPLPSRLAAALLRLRAGRDHGRRRGRDARPGRGPQARLGAPPPRELPRGREPRPARDAPPRPRPRRQDGGEDHSGPPPPLRPRRGPGPAAPVPPEAAALPGDGRPPPPRQPPGPPRPAPPRGAQGERVRRPRAPRRRATRAPV